MLNFRAWGPSQVGAQIGSFHQITNTKKKIKKVFEVSPPRSQEENGWNTGKNHQKDGLQVTGNI